MIAPITRRKIGALEVLLFAVAFEVLTFDFFSALLFMVLTVACWLGRAHFGGDFSISQLYGLLTARKPVTKDESS